MQLTDTMINVILENKSLKKSLNEVTKDNANKAMLIVELQDKINKRDQVIAKFESILDDFYDE